MKITDTIWQVGGDSLSAAGDGAVYLALFGAQAVLIDAGCGHGHTKIVANIKQIISLAVPIKYLFLTHCHFDHTGGADALRREFGCSIVAHEQDAVFLETGDSEVTAASWYQASLTKFRINHKMQGSRETFSIGNGSITALHAPGHSPGSMVLLTESRGQRVLFGQDVHGPLHPSLLSNHENYIASLTMLLGLEADILCEGHLGIYRGRDTVRRFIQSFISDAG
jgi:glyoxylase-like metal-dependent hydrolase (beta-lactamase superfamily II)